MRVDTFNYKSGVDENGTLDIIFDITLGGTRHWQGGLNAKELVCPTDFACLCIEMLFTPCVCCSHGFGQTLSRGVLMSCNQSCASTSYVKTTQTTARPTMHVSAALSMQYGQVVPYVPVPDLTRLGSQVSGQIAPLQQLYSNQAAERTESDASPCCCCTKCIMQ